jgi:hypothetical protein
MQVSGDGPYLWKYTGFSTVMVMVATHPARTRLHTVLREPSQSNFVVSFRVFTVQCAHVLLLLCPDTNCECHALTLDISVFYIICLGQGVTRVGTLVFCMFRVFVCLGFV